MGARPKFGDASIGLDPSQPWNRPGLSRAQRVVIFVETLNVTSGALAGEPFRLRPWQRDIIEKWYATDKKGNRTIRKGLISVARKNGKTALCAALALCHLVGPEQESRGQIVVGAADRDQSGLIFDELCAFIEENETFLVECNIKRFEKIIEHLPTKTKFAALSSDAKKAHGLSPSVVILDELAQWGDTKVGRRLYEALTTAQGARKEPLVLIIGTQSAEDHALMSQLVDYAKQNDDPKFAGVVYEIPPEADVWDESTWPLANPALDDFRSLEDMRELALQARKLPSLEGTFRNLFCNQRASMDEPWISEALWKACKAEINPADLAGRECFGGLDLSGKNDLTSLTLVFPVDEEFHVLSYFWAAREGLEDKGFKDHAPYMDWAKAGYLYTTPGRVIDYPMVADRVAELAAVYKIRQLAVDRYRMDEFQKCLEELRVDLEMFPHGQGYKDFGPAVEAVEDVVLSERLKHGGHPVLDWCIRNVQISKDPAGNRKFDKMRATGRIDGTVSLAMAIHAATIYGEGPSVYEGRGLLTL